MKTRVIYPGTFDPVTYGHIDLIRRARRISDEVIVAVAQDAAKDCLFSLTERLAMLKQATTGMRGIKVESFRGLVVDFVRQRGAHVVVRGLRMLSDFEYEFQMALTNRKLAPDVETIFLMPKEEYSFLSSRLIKEAAALGADLSGFVSPAVAAALKRKTAKTRKAAKAD